MHEFDRRGGRQRRARPCRRTARRASSVRTGADPLRWREHRVGHRCSTPARRRRAPAARAPRRRAPDTSAKNGRDRDHRTRLSEHQHVLIAEEGLARAQAQAGGLRIANDPVGSTRSSIAGPGPPPSFVKSTMPMRPWGLSDLGDVAQQRDRLLHLVIRVDDQDGVDGVRAAADRSLCRARSSTFLQPLALHAALDRLDHLALDVFGVDHAVRTDAARQPDGEPAAAGAEVSDDACLRRCRSASMIWSGRCHASRSGPSSTPRSSGGNRRACWRVRRDAMHRDRQRRTTRTPMQRASRWSSSFVSLTGHTRRRHRFAERIASS